MARVPNTSHTYNLSRPEGFSENIVKHDTFGVFLASTRSVEPIYLKGWPTAPGLGTNSLKISTFAPILLKEAAPPISS